MASNDSRTSLVRVGIVAAAFVAIVGGYVFWQQVVCSPQNVFAGMLENSLRTRSVSKTTSQSNEFQTVEQKIQLQTGQENFAHAFTTLTQETEGAADATVLTETISTSEQDFVRYVDISTDQLGRTGQPLDFSQVLGIWGRSSTVGATGGQLFGETALGIIPVGYMGYEDRSELLSLIKDLNVYEIDYSATEKTKENGRLVYSYDVKIEPENYVTVLKKFAESVGLNQLEDFDPASFRNSPELNFKIKVDVWSRQLLSIEFTDSNRSEKLEAYGAKTSVELPEDSISVTELQLRLQTIE